MSFRKKSPDIFERLEKEAADELRLLDDLGPKFFDTDHLMELHAKVCERIKIRQRQQKITLSIGAASIGWLLLGAIAHFLSFSLLAYVSYGLASVGLLAFLGLLFYAAIRFNTVGHLNHSRHSIEDELRNRQDKQRKRLEDW